MKFLSLALCVAGVACSWYDDSDFPETAVAIAPPAEFRVWWEIVENCSGRAGSFDAVKWFRAEDLNVRGQFALGAWFAGGNRIALIGSDYFGGDIVRHEMLHAILRDGGHPSEYFESRCGDVVVCGRDCPTEDIPPDPTPLSADDVEVNVVAFPRVPSLLRHEGRISFVVSIRNPTNRHAYFDEKLTALSPCPVGIFGSSVENPDRYLLTCTYVGLSGLPRFYLAGESRSVVIDVDLRNLEPGQGPILAEKLVVGAVLGDNVRRTVLLVIRP